MMIVAMTTLPIILTMKRVMRTVTKMRKMVLMVNSLDTLWITPVLQMKKNSRDMSWITPVLQMKTSRTITLLPK